MAPRLRGDAYILEYRGVRQNIGDLIGAGDTFLRNRVAGQPSDIFAVENDTPAARPQHAGQAIKERAFTGAVGADDGADLVARRFETDLRECRKSAEADRQGLGLEHRRKVCSPAIGRGAWLGRGLRAHLTRT